MPRPPSDDEWDDVIAQVEEALEELSIHRGAVKDALLDGVREALTSLVPDEDASVVTVIDGGREEEPSTGASPPELHVVHDEPEPIADPGPSRSVAHVRVVTPASVEGRTETVSGPALEQRGRIRVVEQDGERPWQTLYRGAVAHPYRLFCSAGALEISLDGMPADELGTGQSMDVDARLVRVRTSQGTARGTYVRLS